jgi:hypothetical protein
MIGPTVCSSPTSPTLSRLGLTPHDILTTATVLWVSLHGLAVLRATAPEFPFISGIDTNSDIACEMFVLEPQAAAF